VERERASKVYVCEPRWTAFALLMDTCETKTSRICSFSFSEKFKSFLVHCYKSLKLYHYIILLRVPFVHVSGDFFTVLLIVYTESRKKCSVNIIWRNKQKQKF
jgi:hypothetical protein